MTLDAKLTSMLMKSGKYLVKTLAFVADLLVEGKLGLDMIKSLSMNIDEKKCLSFIDDRIPKMSNGKFG